MCCRTDRECGVCLWTFGASCVLLFVVLNYGAGLRIEEMENQLTGQLALTTRPWPRRGSQTITAKSCSNN